jgi:hypothetical protein
MGSSRRELLAAIDVIRRVSESRVSREVNCQRGNVGRSDDAADGERRAQLIARGLEPVAEGRRRRRGVDEAGRDEVDPDRRKLGGAAGREGRHCRGDSRRDSEAGGRSVGRRRGSSAATCHLLSPSGQRGARPQAPPLVDAWRAPFALILRGGP